MQLSTYSPLLTDFYQLTMAYGYFRLKKHEDRAVFHLLFRKNPFNGNYAISAGMGSVISFLQAFQFTADDLTYLAALKSSDHALLFPADFLDYLKNLKFSCDIDAVPEGTIVFPHAPLLRIEGPLIQCQLLESALLNIINFQTLIATKASRVMQAARGDTVIEFGLRRAQGPDGALSASRAAYIGGCDATSNALAGKLYDIPVRGTHAHSWVTAFESEAAAFEAYASVMPNNCVLLVDTYNTLTGVKHAIETAKTLAAKGQHLQAIRLDSGDLALLSIKAREMLDAAGFADTQILASNSLDEYVIADLKRQGAKISIWGVGTNLATAYDHPALDGVYKLTALQEKGKWLPKLKLSEQEIKVTNPGRHQVRRFFLNDQYFMDVIYDIDLGISDTPDAVLFDALQSERRLDDFDGCADLLEPVFRAGKLIHAAPSIHDIRENAITALKDFHSKQGEKPYPVGLEKNLHDVKLKLMEEFKGVNK